MSFFVTGGAAAALGVSCEVEMPEFCAIGRKEIGPKWK
jgi:hypothetical protein